VLVQGAAGVFKEWDRGVGDTDEMVEKWSTLGFVVARTGPDGRTIMVETERTAPDPE
jgi:hypothetical protein